VRQSDTARAQPPRGLEDLPGVDRSGGEAFGSHEPHSSARHPVELLDELVFPRKAQEGVVAKRLHGIPGVLGSLGERFVATLELPLDAAHEKDIAHVCRGLELLVFGTDRSGRVEDTRPQSAGRGAGNDRRRDASHGPCGPLVVVHLCLP